MRRSCASGSPARETIHAQTTLRGYLGGLPDTTNVVTVSASIDACALQVHPTTAV